MTGEAHSHNGTLLRGYTLALGLAAVLLGLGAISIYSLADAPSTDTTLRWAYVLSARIHIAIAACFAFVVVLRVRGSAFSPGATSAASILLLFFFPFGTAVFLYWFFSIRKRERGERAAQRAVAG